jgi:aspartate kinase
VYKFGGSSVADAERMRNVAEIICSFPDELPCVVVSAMGKTTNLLLEAGRLAVSTGTDSVPSMKALQRVKALHRDTCVSLDVDEETVASVEKLLSELQQLLIGLSIVQV